MGIDDGGLYLIYRSDMMNEVDNRGIRREEGDTSSYPQEQYYIPRNGDNRVKRPEMRKHWQVGKIWDLHREIMRRIMLGQKNTVIAQALGCGTQTVSNVRNSPVIEDQLTIMRGARDAGTISLSKDIQEFAPIALGLLKDIIEGKNQGAAASINLRAKEANNWLDRPGSTIQKVSKVEGIVGHFTGEELMEIKNRARGKGPIVDAEYEEVKT
jgi:hypothetical protein